MIKKILFLGAISLLLGAAVRVMTASAPAVAGGASPDARRSDETFAVTAEEGRALLREVATIATPGLRTAALSADGTTLAWVDGTGQVRRVDTATRKTLWRTAPLAGVNQLRVVPGGGVLACSLYSPASPLVRLLHPKWGDKHALTFTVDGAVWDMALDAEGTRAVVGTGQKSLYVLPLTLGGTSSAATSSSRTVDLPRPEPFRWRAPGIPSSVAVASARPVVFLGLWQAAGVNARLLDGTSRWRSDSTEPERDYTVRLSPDGSTAAAVSTRGRRGGDARLEVWDAPTGRRLWTENLGAREARALVSQDGQYVAVSYVRASSTSASPENKVALFDREGKRLFSDKGSAVFHPRLVALAQDGSRLVVQSGPDTLFVLNNQGRFLGKRRLTPDPKTGEIPMIRDVVVSDDGRYLLLQRADERVTLLKAAP